MVLIVGGFRCQLLIRNPTPRANANAERANLMTSFPPNLDPPDLDKTFRPPLTPQPTQVVISARPPLTPQSTLVNTALPSTMPNARGLKELQKEATFLAVKERLGHFEAHNRGSRLRESCNGLRGLHR